MNALPGTGRSIMEERAEASEGNAINRLAAPPTGNRRCGLLSPEDGRKPDAAHPPRATRLLRHVFTMTAGFVGLLKPTWWTNWLREQDFSAPPLSTQKTPVPAQ